MSSRREVVIGVLDFILDARGKIFQFAILYLLEGLVDGLRACSNNAALKVYLDQHEIDKISRISRLPGLPEIAGDLYKQYCAQICELTSTGWTNNVVPAHHQIHSEVQKLSVSTEPRADMQESGSSSGNLSSLQELRKRIEDSHHRCIQGDNYAPMCKTLVHVLDTAEAASLSAADLHVVLE